MHICKYLYKSSLCENNSFNEIKINISVITLIIIDGYVIRRDSFLLQRKSAKNWLEIFLAVNSFIHQAHMLQGGDAKDMSKVTFPSWQLRWSAYVPYKLSG